MVKTEEKIIFKGSVYEALYILTILLFAYNSSKFFLYGSQVKP